MKASNKFRSTNTFCILSGDAGKIAVLVKHYGVKLVSIAHQHVPKGSYEQARTYVLRLVDNRDLVDVEVYIDSLDNVIEKERNVVLARKDVEPAGPVLPDFSYQRSTLSAHTPAARAWVAKNIVDHGYTGNSHFVDTPYIKGVAKLIEAAGLSILIV